MTISKPTLERWLLRSCAGADRVQLIHKDADDESRIVQTYALRTGAKDELESAASEVIADGQNEADLAETRVSFVLRTMRRDVDDIEHGTIATLKLRFEPRTGNGADTPDEPSRDGLLQIAMDNLKFAYRELGAAPQRQRLVYENLIELLSKQVSAQQSEIRELHKLLSKAGVVDAETQAILSAEAEKRSEMFTKALGEGMEIVKHVAGAVAAQHFNGATGAQTNGHVDA